MQPDRIFVRAPNWVGDLVMATASFARLRRGFPQAHITCGLRPYLRSLLAGSGYFDDFVDMPKAGGIRGLWQHARAIRRGNHDLAVVFPNSMETALGVFLGGVPERLGYRHGRSWLINRGLYAEQQRGQWGKRGLRRVPTPMPEYYAKLLDVLELEPGGLRGELTVTDEERERCDAWLAEHGVAPDQMVVSLNSGASYGGSKLWEPDKFAAVARHFRDRHGAAVVLLSGPGEVDMVRGIAADSGAIPTIDPVQPVGMLKPMLARSALLISTDSGPRHVGVAMRTPTVCLIGPNDRRYTDYCLEGQVVIQKDIECAPCQRKVCPLGHRNCMVMITVDEVIAAGESLLRAS